MVTNRGNHIRGFIITISILLLALVLILILTRRENSKHKSLDKSNQNHIVFKSATDTEKQSHPFIKPSPAPNTVIALVDSSVLHNGYLTIRIAGVVAYGSSTPALPKGTMLDIGISGVLLSKQSVADIGLKINSGKQDTLVLYYSSVIGLNNKGEKWTLNRIQ